MIMNKAPRHDAVPYDFPTSKILRERYTQNTIPLVIRVKTTDICIRFSRFYSISLRICVYPVTFRLSAIEIHKTSTVGSWSCESSIFLSERYWALSDAASRRPRCVSETGTRCQSRRRERDANIYDKDLNERNTKRSHCIHHLIKLGMLLSPAA